MLGYRSYIGTGEVGHKRSVSTGPARLIALSYALIGVHPPVVGVAPVPGID
jgi:hypothetical protein